MPKGLADENSFRCRNGKLQRENPWLKKSFLIMRARIAHAGQAIDASSLMLDGVRIILDFDPR